jgi:ATP-dependent helicase HepA
MLRQAEAAAAQRSAQRVARAREEMAACLGQEQARLLALQRLNGAVGVSELRLLQEQQATLDQHLQAGRPRLDALHLIRRGR